MLALTLIRLLRDALCLVAAVGLALSIVAIFCAVDAYRFESDWRLGGDVQLVLLTLLVISGCSSAAWFFVQRRERKMARRGLTSQWS